MYLSLGLNLAILVDGVVAAVVSHGLEVPTMGTIQFAVRCEIVGSEARAFLLDVGVAPEGSFVVCIL